MFGLHNVPSAHSFPFMKQDRSTCRRYMRTVYWQNGEQVSRTVLTLRFQLDRRAESVRCSSICTSLFPSNHEDLEEVQPEVCSKWRRMEEISLAGEAACELKKKRVTKPRMRTYTTYAVGRI